MLLHGCRTATATQFEPCLDSFGALETNSALRLQGFITASDTALNIAQLPWHSALASPWPVQMVPLRATPLCIAYYPQARLYLVAVAKEVSRGAGLQPTEASCTPLGLTGAHMCLVAVAKAVSSGPELWSSKECCSLLGSTAAGFLLLVAVMPRSSRMAQAIALGCGWLGLIVSEGLTVPVAGGSCNCK